MGISAGILFIALQKFYDSVDLVLLIKACNGLDYPRVPLLLLVQAFVGPRTLRADGHHNEQIPVANGLVAGSSQANYLARALLHRAPPDHHHHQLVDGLKTHTEGTTRQVVFRFLWWLVSPSARKRAKRAFVRTRRIRSFAKKAHACQSPPVQRRSIASEHIWSPDLEHSAHIHEAFESCGCMDH